MMKIQQQAFNLVKLTFVALTAFVVSIVAATLALGDSNTKSVKSDFIDFVKINSVHADVPNGGGGGGGGGESSCDGTSGGCTGGCCGTS